MTNNKLIWFRSDLRLLDNPALHHAFQNVSTSAGTGSATPPPALIALYVLSPAEWKAHDVSPVKIDFVLRNLQCLSATLWKNLRIPLLIRHASTAKHVHQVVVDVVQQYGISDIYWNAEYEVNERRRDEAVKKLLTNDQRSLHVHQFDDQCVVLPGLLRSKSSNSAYTVYSPFKKSWFELVRNGRGNYLNVFPVPQRSADALKVVEGVLEALSLRGPDTVPDKVDGFEVAGGLEMKNLLSEDWPAGEDEALKRLQAFGEQKGLANYKDARDIPSQPGTSRLSAYLACGVISAKKCVVKAVEFNGGKLDSGTLGKLFLTDVILYLVFLSKFSIIDIFNFN
jgi:deoxyribodipyrimidine photo-lyase